MFLIAHFLDFSTLQDVFSLVPAAEIRALREENPSNLATLCFKAVGKLEHAAQNGAQTQKEQEVRRPI